MGENAEQDKKILRYEVFKDWVYLVEYDLKTSTMRVELDGPESSGTPYYRSRYDSPEEKAKAVGYHCVPAKLMKEK